MDPGIVLAHSIRDGRVQAVHCGHAVLMDADGTRLGWGRPHDVATYVRSSIKPLQALPFAGVMDALGLEARHLAVACGSHAAEAGHLEAARQVLEAARLDEADLQCGVHPVLEATSVPRPEGGWSAIHNNCSGKHAAMLATCVHRGWDTGTYLEPDHPLQQEILGHVARAAGTDEVPFGVDGCGLPTYWLTIGQLARTFLWLATGSGRPGRRVLDAMGRHPVLFGGQERLDSRLAQVTDGQVIAKIGALGVHAAVHVGRGEAIALKISDGSSPARDAVLAALARRAGWIDDADLDALGDLARPPVRNHAGLRLGHVLAVGA